MVRGGEANTLCPDLHEERRTAQSCTPLFLLPVWICATLIGSLVGATLYILLRRLSSDTNYGFQGAFPPANVPLCHTPGCQYMSEAFTIAVNAAVSPCHDFFEFVCSKYSDPVPRTLVRLQQDMWTTVRSLWYSSKVPRVQQSATQKATALFRACVNIATRPINDMQALKDFMKRIGVEVALQQHDTDNVVDKIVRLGLEYNIPTLLKIMPDENLLWNGKRVLLISYNEEDKEWYKTRPQLTADDVLFSYSALLQAYGYGIGTAVEEERHRFLLRATIGAEDKAAFETKVAFQNRDGNEMIAYVKVKDIGNFTPTIPSTKWIALIKKYSGGEYGVDDMAAVYVPALVFLDSLLSQLKPSTAKLLVAWDILRSHGRDVHGQIFALFPPRDLRPEEYCAKRVSTVMPVALYATYLFNAISASDIKSATDVLLRVRDAYLAAFEKSSWMTGEARRVALRKLRAMSLHAGYPDGLGDEAGLDSFYKDYPDVGASFFTSWVGASRLSQKKKMNESMGFIFRVGEVNAYYLRSRNTIALLAPILRPPVLVSDGPFSINFGALGQVAGHEMMHGYDVTGSMIDDQGWQRDWWSATARDHYVSQALCLRSSYDTLPRRHSIKELNDTLDSENMADFVGLIIASRAYRGMNPSRETRLPGLPFTPAQLFFLAHCYKWCAAKGTGPGSPRYATNMKRCNVPVMNMKEFAAAFGCKEGDRMNPGNKCSFW